MSAFIWGMFYWRKKSKTRTPIFVYWICGTFFVLLMSYTLFEFALRYLAPSIKYFSAILGIACYVMFGTYLSKEENKIRSVE
jgi:hypothetical protein